MSLVEIDRWRVTTSRLLNRRIRQLTNKTACALGSGGLRGVDIGDANGGFVAVAQFSTVDVDCVAVIPSPSVHPIDPRSYRH